MRTLRVRIERLEQSVPKPGADRLSEAELRERIRQLDERIARTPQPDPVREAERERRAKLPPEELLAILLAEEPARVPEERFTSPRLTVGQRLSARVEALDHLTWELEVARVRSLIGEKAATAGAD